MSFGSLELGEKFGVAGLPKSGAVENALGNWIGDNRTGSSGDDIADRLTNRGYGRVRTGAIRSARLRCRRMAGGYDRQGIRECSESIFGANVGDFDLKSESFPPVPEQVAIPEQ